MYNGHGTWTLQHNKWWTISHVWNFRWAIQLRMPEMLEQVHAHTNHCSNRLRLTYNGTLYGFDFDPERNSIPSKCRIAELWALVFVRQEVILHCLVYRVRATVAREHTRNTAQQCRIFAEYRVLLLVSSPSLSMSPSVAFVSVLVYVYMLGLLNSSLPSLPHTHTASTAGVHYKWCAAPTCVRTDNAAARVACQPIRLYPIAWAHELSAALSWARACTCLCNFRTRPRTACFRCNLILFPSIWMLVFVHAGGRRTADGIGRASHGRFVGFRVFGLPVLIFESTKLHIVVYHIPEPLFQPVRGRE